MTTTYFLNCIMGNLFKTKTLPALPTTFYIGLSTTTPTLSGTNVTEPLSSAGYARVKLDTLSTPTDGVIKNTDEIEFPESTSDWGTVTHFVIYDDVVGGNLLMYEQLTNPRTVEAATIVTAKADNLTLTLKNPT